MFHHAEKNHCSSQCCFWFVGQIGPGRISGSILYLGECFRQIEAKQLMSFQHMRDLCMRSVRLFSSTQFFLQKSLEILSPYYQSNAGTSSMTGVGFHWSWGFLLPLLTPDAAIVHRNTCLYLLPFLSKSCTWCEGSPGTCLNFLGTPQVSF